MPTNQRRRNSKTRANGGVIGDGDMGAYLLERETGLRARFTKEPLVITITDEFGTRTLIVPAGETFGGDVAKTLLAFEQQYGVRLRDGQNPLWFFRVQRDLCEKPHGGNLNAKEFRALVLEQYPEMFEARGANKHDAGASALKAVGKRAKGNPGAKEQERKAKRQTICNRECR